MNLFLRGSLQQFVYQPACWTDGSIPGGLPEGAVLQLDPHLDLSRLSLSAAGRTIARALQAYGAVCVDFAGGNVIYAEGLYGHRDRSWKGLLDVREIESLGYQHFRVLDMGRTIPFGADDWTCTTLGDPWFQLMSYGATAKINNTLSYVNDGTQTTNTATIVNNIAKNFFDGRVRFLKNSAAGYSVSNGVKLAEHPVQDVA